MMKPSLVLIALHLFADNSFALDRPKPLKVDELAAIGDKRGKVSEMARLLRIKHKNSENRDGTMTDAAARIDDEVRGRTHHARRGGAVELGEEPL